MYLSHFALSEPPFSIAPDPRYLFMSQRHKEALAHLIYGLSGDGGFVVLSGEVGAGKTTVCRCLLEQIPPDCDLAYVFNPKLTVDELLATLCTEFGIALPAAPQGSKILVDALNAFLLEGHAKGRHAVLIIDEAQNLSPEVLEQMRLLTNLETSQRKLLQIILVGQPELDQMLAKPNLRQLAQRVVARYHLDALSRDELAAYIQHRLQIAGCQRALFPASLVATLYRLTGGVPRLVNLLCDRALLGAYVEGKHAVSKDIMLRAAGEVLPLHRPATPPRSRWPWLAACAVPVLAAAAAWAIYQQPPRPAQPTSKATPAPAARDVAKPLPTSEAPPPVLAAPKENTPAATTVASQASAVTVADRIDWPADQPRDLSLDLAFAALYGSWGTTMPATEHCPAVTSLRCRHGRASLDELRQLNRPALLYLNDEQGQALHGVLLQLAKDSATLVVAGHPQTISLSALAAHWSGRYTLLWRAPAYLPDNFRGKESGQAIAWLARQLALSEGKPADSKPPRQLDDAMRDAIRRFQFDHGLPPDGQVGAQTLIRLSAAGDDAAPRLVREQR
ncbi:AAA family ATPase [Chitinimonas sp.]|uniref:ExeA family protein n=1 Tax=Chitinimonas sp. TaxID=1934313 RepID=UPI0035B4C210